MNFSIEYEQEDTVDGLRKSPSFLVFLRMARHPTKPWLKPRYLRCVLAEQLEHGESRPQPVSICCGVSQWPSRKAKRVLELIARYRGGHWRVRKIIPFFQGC